MQDEIIEREPEAPAEDALSEAIAIVEARCERIERFVALVATSTRPRSVRAKMEAELVALRLVVSKARGEF
jgi:hypothetical protein